MVADCVPQSCEHDRFRRIWKRNSHSKNPPEDRYYEGKAGFAFMKHVTQTLLICLIATAALVCRGQRSGGSVDNAAIQTEVEFRSGNITLSGTLVVPSNMVAAVVFVHGNGRQTRNVGLADALAHLGVATLTYDKRGVGKSGGVYAGPEVGTNNVDPRNLSLLAQDASAAAAKLVHEIRSPRIPVGFLGMSQAGWIIPLAALRTPDVKFMILWSGPLVTTLEQLRFQFFTDGKEDFWDHHSETEVREHIRSDPDRYKFVATDPVDSLRKLSIAGLWVYGERDVFVPVGMSIERLQALAARGKPFEYRLLPASGHDLPFPQALSASREWLNKIVIEQAR